jgi:hypothetical protein
MHERGSAEYQPSLSAHESTYVKGPKVNREAMYEFRQTVQKLSLGCVQSGQNRPKKSLRRPCTLPDRIERYNSVQIPGLLGSRYEALQLYLMRAKSRSGIPETHFDLAID